MKKAPACPRVDIGGQAVMEGVMMKSPDAIAIAVRRPDDSIVVQRKEYVAPSKKHKWMGLPVIRGVVNFCTMLSMGMSTLEASTQMLGTGEEEPTKFELWLAKKLGKGVDKVVMGVAIVLAVILSVGLFFVIPEAVASGLRSLGMGRIAVNLLSGLVRIAMLIGYMIFCSFVPDVRRTFQYHGAEHKTIYCHEADQPLTPENAAPFTTLHPRCGTAFLLIVFTLSIILFTLVGYNGDQYILRLLSRLALLPIVAGVSYEILKGLAHSDNKITNALRWPGLQLQRLTTKQPDAKMLEIAIVAFNVALYGLPQNAPTTEEGYTLLHSYKESEKGYAFPAQEAAQ